MTYLGLFIIAMIVYFSVSVSFAKKSVIYVEYIEWDNQRFYVNTEIKVTENNLKTKIMHKESKTYVVAETYDEAFDIFQEELYFKIKYNQYLL